MSDLEFSALQTCVRSPFEALFIRHFISTLQVILMSLGPRLKTEPKLSDISFARGITDERTMHNEY